MTAAGQAGVLNAGTARFYRNPVRLFVGHSQQRQRLCRAERKHPFYNTALGVTMFFARYWLAIPALAIGGSLALKKKVPAAGAGTLSTHTRSSSFG